MRNLDVVREAAGRNAALVKESAGVKARGFMTVELIGKGKAEPVVSGVEILEEK